MGEWKKSLEGFNKLFELYPNDIEILLELTKIYDSNYMFDEAIDSIIKSLSVTKQINENIHIISNLVNLLCDLYIKKNDYESPFNVVEKYLNSKNFEDYPVEVKKILKYKDKIENWNMFSI
jgi:tetratricopeptide (TPR) repeat protein